MIDRRKQEHAIDISSIEYNVQTTRAILDIYFQKFLQKRYLDT